YIEKHPRSKYAKKMGGTGGKPVSKAPAKKPSATSPLPEAKPKPKKKMDPAKKKARVSKIKEMIKKADIGVKKVENRLKENDLRKDYLNKLISLWSNYLHEDESYPYRDRINKKLISLTNQLEKNLDKVDS